jgi:membrane protease YdiL (CAAX protease family)
VNNGDDLVGSGKPTIATGPHDLFTQASPRGLAGKILQFPLCRMIVAVIFLLPVFALDKAVKVGVLRNLPENVLVWARYLEAAAFFALFLLAFYLYAKWIEKRKASEICTRVWPRDLGLGFAVAFVLVGLVVGILAASGCYAVTGTVGNKRVVLDLFAKFFMGAFLEELLFRLVVFKLTEELLGTWVALAIQAAFFGASHMLDHANLSNALAVAVIGGLTYTGGYMVSRNLWLPLGLHWGWNFFQSGIFGMPNSGTPYEGLLTPRVSGPAWLTGGSFGIEGSYVAIAFCLASGLVLLMCAIKNKRMVRFGFRV